MNAYSDSSLWFGQVLNDETFAIMVLMALFTTFITTPIVMALYKPARNPVPYIRRKLDMEDPKDDLRILSCVHGMKNVPAMINLTEATRGMRKRALRLYILHLMELSERTSSILIVQRARKDGRPYFNQRLPAEDQIGVAFETYGQLSKVQVSPLALSTPCSDDARLCQVNLCVPQYRVHYLFLLYYLEI